NYFWTSTFNGELLHYTQIPHKCTNIEHYYNYNYHTGCRYTHTKKHSCDCKKITFHKHRGCQCKTVIASKRCKGLCGKDSSCFCCDAINKLRTKELEKNPKLSATKIKNLAHIDADIYPGCGCTWRHKNTCLCFLGKCGCPCECACCTKTCSHDTKRSCVC